MTNYYLSVVTFQMYTCTCICTLLLPANPLPSPTHLYPCHLYLAPPNGSIYPPSLLFRSCYGNWFYLTIFRKHTKNLQLNVCHTYLVLMYRTSSDYETPSIVAVPVHKLGEYGTKTFHIKRNNVYNRNGH